MDMSQRDCKNQFPHQVKLDSLTWEWGSIASSISCWAELPQGHWAQGTDVPLGWKPEVREVPEREEEEENIKSHYLWAKQLAYPVRGRKEATLCLLSPLFTRNFLPETRGVGARQCMATNPYLPYTRCECKTESTARSHCSDFILRILMY